MASPVVTISIMTIDNFKKSLSIFLNKNNHQQHVGLSLGIYARRELTVCEHRQKIEEAIQESSNLF